MNKKLVCIGVMLIICMSIGLSGCGDKEYKMVTDSLSVCIKTEFREKFKTEEFTVEDFQWSNVKEIEYSFWYDLSESHGWMTVYLKKCEKKRVLAAVDHFKTLDFVKDANPHYYGSFDV